MTNTEIVNRCKSGDREAMEVLYITFAPKMMRLIRRYITSSDTAKDLLHDSFIVIFTRIGDVNNCEKLEYWMATIVKNLCLTHLAQLDLTTLLNEETTEIEDVPDLDELLSFSEIEDLINKLPKGYRNVFRLAVFENKSHQEIGKILGIAPHSSSSQLSHAKAMLRRMIIERKKELGLTTILLLICIGGYLLFNRTFYHNPLIYQANLPGQVAETASDIPGNDSVLNQSQNDHGVTTINNNTIAGLSGTQPSSKHLTLPFVAKKSASQKTIPTVVTDTTSSLLTKEAISALYSTTDSVPSDKKSEEIAPSVNQKTESRPDHSKDVVKPLIARAANGSRSSWSFGPHIGMGTIIDMPKNADMANTPVLSGPTYLPRPPILTPLSIISIDNAIPLEFGLNVTRKFSDRLAVESGITYTMLRSNLIYSRGINKINVKWHYIGIPLNLNVDIWSSHRISIYGSIGGAVNFPVATTLSDSDIPSNGLPQPQIPDSRIQFSTKAAIGFQYNLNPNIGLYIEPGFRYNFKNNSKIENYWQEHKSMISLPIGVRFQW